MSLEEFLQKQKIAFETKKVTAMLRITQSEELLELLETWLVELGALKYMSFVCEESTNSLELVGKSYYLQGMGHRIWFRLIRDPEIMCVMIGKSKIFLQENSWTYKEKGLKKTLTISVLEEILIKEMTINEFDCY